MILCFIFVVGFLVCPHQLGAEGATDLWKLALQDGYVLSLFRDEYLLIHLLYSALVRKYRKVIQNYHLKFLGGFDAAQMREIVMVYYIYIYKAFIT